MVLIKINQIEILQSKSILIQIKNMTVSITSIIDQIEERLRRFEGLKVGNTHPSLWMSLP